MAGCPGCDRLQLSAHLNDCSDKDRFFDPRSLTWQEAAPSILSDYWYLDGHLFLHLGPDTAKIGPHLSLDWSVASSGSYMRVTYSFADWYYAAYFKQISADTLRYVLADKFASSEAQLDTIAASGDWQILTNFIPWQILVSNGPPQLLLGNWRTADQSSNITIGQDQVTLDGTDWSMDSIQTDPDQHVFRMVLGRPDTTMVIYYHLTSQQTADLLPWNATDNLLDPYGNFIGQWRQYIKWQDLLETTEFTNTHTSIARWKTIIRRPHLIAELPPG